MTPDPALSRSLAAVLVDLALRVDAKRVGRAPTPEKAEPSPSRESSTAPMTPAVRPAQGV